MAKKKDSVEELPVQDEEVREKILLRSSGGHSTATGQARMALSGREEERISGLKDRGSTVPIAGGDGIVADGNGQESQEPQGAQAQPSSFATNGSLPVGMVASPTGLVPVSSVTSDPARASELIQQNMDAQKEAILSTGFRKLSRRQVESMSAAELRAVASDRGYDIGDYAGSRATRSRFLAAQEKDEENGLVEDENEDYDAEPVPGERSGEGQTRAANEGGRTEE